MQIWMWITGFLALAAAITSVIAGCAHRKTRTYFNTMMASGTAAVIFGFVLLTLAGIANKRAAYAEFLQDCTQDHKQYECMLM
jgi:Na+/alanine symporter